VILHNVLLNNKIPFVLQETDESQSVIYYNSFAEHFFGVAEIGTKTKNIILEYTEEHNQKYVTADVTLENGTCHKNVKFKLVKSNNPAHSTVNFNLSPETETVQFIEEQPEIVEQEPPAKLEMVQEMTVQPDNSEEHRKKTLQALREQYPSSLNLKPVFLNKIPMVVLQDGNQSNTLYCKSFEEYLFGVGIFNTKTKEAILEYTEEQGERYVTADVTFENGEQYKQIKFHVIISDSVEIPFSTINPNTLGKKFITQLPVIATVPAPAPVVIEESLPEPEPAPDHLIEQVLAQKKRYEQATQQAILKEKQLEKQAQQLVKQQLLHDNEAIILEKLQQYKRDLLQEYLDTVEKQKQLLQIKADESLEKAEHAVHEHLLTIFDQYKNELRALTETSQEQTLDTIITKLDTHIQESRQNISTLLQEQFDSKSQQVDEQLAFKAVELQKHYDQKLLLELESYKDRLFIEFKTVSDSAIADTLKKKTDATVEIMTNIFADKEKKLQESVDAKLLQTKQDLQLLVQQFKDQDIPELTSHVEKLQEKVKNILAERDKPKKQTFTEEQRKYINDTAQYWARRMLDLGGGGGSVAVQYAKGGIMNGDLNINGHILSGGKNIANYFGSGGGGDPAVNTLVHSNSAQWDEAYSNLVANSANYLSGFDIGYINSNFVHLSGDTMTGGLSAPALSADAVTAGSLLSNTVQASNSVGIGQYNPLYFNLDVNGSGTGTIGNSYGPLGFGSADSITIAPNNYLVLSPVDNIIVRPSSDTTTIPNERLTVVGNISSTGTIYADSALVNLSEPDATTPNNKLQTTSITVKGQDVTAGGQVPSTVIKGTTFFGKSDGSIGILASNNTAWGPSVFEFSGVNFNITQYNNIYFTAGYYPQFWLDTSGNVGIHTAYPNAHLHVKGSSDDITSPIAIIESTGSQAPYTFRVNNTDQAYAKGDNAGNLAFGAQNFITFEAGGFGGAAEKMRIQSDGNIGIGTITPTTLLDVTGVITASGGNSNQWNTGYNNAIYTVNGTANQIVATPTGNNTGNNSVTLSFAPSAYFPGNVSVQGNLYVSGSAAYINVNNLVVDDALIYLANSNVANLLDIGFVAHFTQSPLGYQHTGLVRRAGEGRPGTWTLFSGLTTEPLTGNNIDWADKNITLDSLSANIYSSTGNSNQWSSNWSTTNANSALWNSNYTTTNTNSANWSQAYTNLTSNSAAYLSGADLSLIATTSASWNSAYTTVSSNSANWSQAYTNLVTNSAAYLSGVNISLLAAASGSWNSVYTTTNTNSAAWSNWSTVSANYALGSQYVKLSGDTMTGTLSAPKIVLTATGSSSNPAIILSGVNFNSGIYLTSDGDGISINTRNNYTNLAISSLGVLSDRIIGTTSDGSVTSPSVLVGYDVSSGLYRPAANNIGFTIASTERARINSSGLTVVGTISTNAHKTSQDWLSNWTTTNSNSANWSQAYTNLTSNSAAYLSGVDISLLVSTSASWNSTYTTVNSNSARWSSVYTTVNSNSASWLNQGTLQTYLSTNNVLLSSCTITNNLSVLGTIYSTTSAYATKTVTANIGDGVNTSYTVTHNFGTTNVQVAVYDNATNVLSYPTVTITSANAVSLGFSTAPALNAYRVSILGAVPSSNVIAYGPVVGTLASLAFAASDEQANITSGGAKIIFTIPQSFTLTKIKGGLNTAATGSSLIFSLSSQTNNNTAGTVTMPAGAVVADAAVNYACVENDRMCINVTQVGSTTPGVGLKVYLIGRYI